MVVGLDLSSFICTACEVVSANSDRLSKAGEAFGKLVASTQEAIVHSNAGVNKAVTHTGELLQSSIAVANNLQQGFHRG